MIFVGAQGLRPLGIFPNPEFIRLGDQAPTLDSIIFVEFYFPNPEFIRLGDQAPTLDLMINLVDFWAQALRPYSILRLEIKLNHH
jgi:hypothetical protein